MRPSQDPRWARLDDKTERETRARHDIYQLHLSDF
jgi:hypothetical protein